MPIPSELTFSTIATFNSRPTTDAEIEAKSLAHQIKFNRVVVDHATGRNRATSELVAARVQQLIRSGAMAGHWDPQSLLVPVPGSAPARPDTQWTARSLVEQLLAVGVGAGHSPLVVRHTAVPKSATARPGERPNFDTHYRSFRIEPVGLHTPTSILLVDDFITRGPTMMAAAYRLREVFPHARIHGFAAVRTLAPGEPFVQFLICARGRVALDQFGSTNCTID
jgi:predicted amidophosphoribosyltransferase